MSVRPRLLLSLILGILVVAGGAVVDARVEPRTTAALPAGDAPSGAWFCPHGALWHSWIVVGNPGEDPSTVRVTSFGEKGTLGEETFDLDGGATRYVEVPEGGAGTMVEYFGTPVAAGWVSKDDGVAAESCRGSAGRTWLVADGDTSRDRHSWLVVLNPFAADAAFDVTLLTSEEAPTRVGTLRGYVLKGHRAVTFKLDDYLLKPAIAAVVSVTLGSVAVSQLGAIDGVGIRAVGAVPKPADRWVLPAALGREASVLSVVDAEEVSAAFSVRQQTSEEQRPIDALTDVSLRGPSVRSYDTDAAEGPAGLVVEVTADVPIAASRRTLGPDGDVGAISGVSMPASSWVIPPTVPPGSGTVQRLVLQNPGSRDVTVHVRLFGDTPEDLGDVTIPAGRTIAVGTDDERLAGAPIWGWVTSDEGTFVAGSASVSMQGRGFALSVGVPLGPPPGT
jgi:hypothetical protein